MAWSIYNNEDITAYRNGIKTDEDPLLTWQKLRLDFSAPAGVHKVQHQSKHGIGYTDAAQMLANTKPEVAHLMAPILDVIDNCGFKP